MPFRLKLRRTRRYNVLSKNYFVTRIRLLDSNVIECTLSVESTGQECLEAVAQRLELRETHFFGLWFQGKTQAPAQRWVELEKPLKKQLDKFGNEPLLFFGVMFYVPSVSRLEQEATRYQYYLQNWPNGEEVLEEWTQKALKQSCCAIRKMLETGRFGQESFAAKDNYIAIFFIGVSPSSVFVLLPQKWQIHHAHDSFPCVLSLWKDIEYHNAFKSAAIGVEYLVSDTIIFTWPTHSHLPIGRNPPGPTASPDQACQTRENFWEEAEKAEVDLTCSSPLGVALNCALEPSRVLTSRRLCGVVGVVGKFARVFAWSDFPVRQ
ncbi:tyrosine-protein phosphatase non-receptor type 14-like isoform X1 [Lates japonicus]|uniref:Tyrosine-protein phosphatase non-receptor type 14-like isoform X1 n=1 Tax=Lates japonicus TaxID=270547 RepID=A0AAD3NBZ7_LATJO|nr:tyrosine-protein phosphatase non-receptor type 14-like isoform X1 [Lates japonicus]